MKKKLKEEAGLTLVELLAATLVLTLLALLLNTGLQMVLRTYQTIIAQSEVELLLSTAVDTLADDLRYGWDVVEDSGDPSLNCAVEFTYYSDSYGEQTRFYLDGDGQLRAWSFKKPEGWRVLSSGAYGSGAYKEYRISPVAADEKIVTYEEKSGEIIFTIKLMVSTSDGKISASTPDGGVSVRCLTPKKSTTGGGP